MEWYLAVLRQYAVFSGRAGRSEYWIFFLVNTLVILAVGVIDLLFGSYGTLGTLYSLATLLPSLGVTVRRLHDTGRSGWWLLVCLIPLIGVIVLIIFTALEGESAANRYGAAPSTMPPR